MTREQREMLDSLNTILRTGWTDAGDVDIAALAQSLIDIVFEPLHAELTETLWSRKRTFMTDADTLPELKQRHISIDQLHEIERAMTTQEPIETRTVALLVGVPADDRS